jgi:hypothetical protein
MSREGEPVADPNRLLALRAPIYTEPGIVAAIGQTYGMTPEPLGLAVEGAPVFAYRQSRPGRRRITLAPFNFQPILRDDGDRVLRAIIDRASQDGTGTGAVVRLHHALAPETIAEFGLSLTAESVETLLALPRGAEVAMAALPQKQRWKFRKAQSGAGAKGVVVRRFSDAPTLRRFYQVLLRAYRDKHRMLPQPYSIFERLLAESVGARRCFGYVAERDAGSEILGGILIMQDETQWCYGWGANAPHGDVEAMDLGTLLIGTSILDAAEAGAPLFNFGASPLSHETLRRFKRKWGGQEHPVLTYGWREELKPVDLHGGFGLAKAVLARMPLKALELISPHAVKWLS